MVISPFRIFLIAGMVAGISVLLTLGILVGLVLYADTQTPRAVTSGGRVPDYYSPPPRGPLVVPMVPREPLVIPTREPSAIEQQRDQCERLGYSRSNWPNAGCR